MTQQHDTLQTHLSKEASKELELSRLFSEAAEYHKEGRPQDAFKLYQKILKLKPNHAGANHNLGIIATSVGKHAGALRHFKTAVDAKPAETHFWNSYLESLSKTGEKNRALAELSVAKASGIGEKGLQKLAKTISETKPLSGKDLFEYHIDLARERFPGPAYNDWLNIIHDVLKPGTYLEIGVEAGQSLAAARHPTRCIAVDPAPKVSCSISAFTKMFADASDDFFAQYDVTDLFEGAAIDLCFIDGFHSFDQALRDFINVEANSHHSSLVLFHDIFPLTELTASRRMQTKFWVGDTWKIIPLLIEERPDLRIATIPTFPSGLALVKNLNPSSNHLSDNLQTLTEQWLAVRFDTYALKLPATLNLLENSQKAIFNFLNFKH